MTECACGCGKQTEGPAFNKWFEAFDWAVMDPDDPRPVQAGRLWFASPRCCWLYGRDLLAAEMAEAGAA